MPRHAPQISLIALMAALPLAALADTLPPSACDPASPADGAVVTCTGTGTGFDAPDADDLVVTVETGAEISEPDQEAIRAGQRLTLTNNGQITSDENDGVYALDGSKVTNYGTISSTYWDGEEGADGLDLGDDAVVINEGTIEGTDNGVEVDYDGDITNSGTITGAQFGLRGYSGTKIVNQQTGVITGTADDGIRLDGEDDGDDADITNHGSIYGGDDGISIDDDGIVRNTGLIDAEEDGVDAWDGLTLTNAGRILAGDNGIEAEDDADITITAEGRIEAEDDGIDIEDDGILRNAGVIEADDDGIVAEDGLTLINDGTIDAGYWAVNAEDDADITNNADGRLLAEDSAIDVDDDAEIRNYGLIDGGNEGIDAGDDLDLTNHGTIEAESIGVEAEDDAEITNAGSILAIEDGINVADGAYIVNLAGGLISSLEEDAIDLDSGDVLNYGTIRSITGEAAIDFDDSEVEVSTITNYGTITGALAINVELGEDENPQNPVNTVSQVLINHGTITGTSGTALRLGEGDDTLDIYSMDINGLVDLGADEDTLIVRSTVQNGVVYFVSDPEVLNMDEAPDTAVYGDLKLVVASRDSFADMDVYAGNQTLGLGKSALVPMPEQSGDGGLAFAERGMGDGAWWATGSAGVFDGDGSGRLSIGRDFDTAGVFLSYGRISAAASDSHELISDSTVLGLHSGRSLASGTQMVGIAYIGFGGLEVHSPSTASGDGSADTRVFGLAGSIASAPSATGVSVVARAGIERQKIGAMTMSGLGGATFGARDVTTGYLSAEARLDHALSNGTVITPFVGMDVLFTDGEDVTMTLGSGTTRFATGSEGTTAQLTLGAELSGAGQPWHLRIEGQYDDAGAAGATLTAGLRF